MRTNRRNPDTPNKERKNIRERLTEAMELPPELALDMPKIYVTGDKYVAIENYKGLILYENNCIRLNSKCGIIEICGRALDIKSITDEEIHVSGKVATVGFKI